MNDNELEILKLAVASGIINLADTQDRVNMLKRENLFKKHNVWLASDGRYKVKVWQDNKFKIVARKTEESMLSFLAYFDEIKPYDEYGHTRHKAPSLKKLYPKWLEYKKTHTRSTSYIQRLNCDYKRFYLNEPLSNKILNKPLSDIKAIDLDMWANSLVKKYGLTKKQYYNMATILKQVCEYCTIEGVDLLEKNPFDKLKINMNMFDYAIKPKSHTQVFLIDEEERLLNYILEKDSDSVVGLAIAFNFQMGLRVGELVALKWGDIDGDYINICKTEIAEYDEEFKRSNYIVANHTKTECGNRTIYIPVKAREILDKVKSLTNGFYCDDYIFIQRVQDNKNNTYNLQRIKAHQIDTYLRTACKRCDIPPKSSHKIRKTYISKLIDSGVNLNTIRERVGHSDERTTLHSYFFDRRNNDDIVRKLDEI